MDTKQVTGKTQKALSVLYDACDTPKDFEIIAGALIRMNTYKEKHNIILIGGTGREIWMQMQTTG